MTKELVTQKSPDFWGLIDASQKIVTHLHERPDPDSVGSALSLKLVLEKMGKSVDVLTQKGHLLPSASFIPGYDSIKEVGYREVDFNDYDLFVMLDVSAYSRITKDIEWTYPFEIPTIIIDHHEQNPIEADVEIVVPNASATCEMLYWLYSDKGVEMHKDIATALFTGIWTDTVGMKIADATYETHQAVANLVKAGAKPNEIIFKIIGITNDQLVQVGKVLASIKELSDGKIIIAYQHLNDVPGIDHFEYTNASEISKLRLSESKDAHIAALLYETEGVVNVSMRANNQDHPIDISVIARSLGGGGHAAAAGAKIEGKDFDEVERLLLTKIEESYPGMFNL